VLKDVLRQYEGQDQETHTVHLVFTPKFGSKHSYKESSQGSTNRQSTPITNRSADMMSSEIRHRQNATPTTTTATPVAASASSSNQQTTNATQDQPQQQQTSSNVHAFYGTSDGMTGGGNANAILAQQYAMQTWMHQAYLQYLNQYMNL